MSEFITGSKKKMLAILASPRKKGNVAKMLNVAVKEAENQGYDIELIHLYEKIFFIVRGVWLARRQASASLMTIFPQYGKA